MSVHTFTIRLGAAELGRLSAICPHCETRQTLSRRELRGSADGLPVPKTEALVCLGCEGVSRKEGRAARMGSVVALVPFAVLLFGGVVTGLYLAVSMYMEGPYSPTFGSIAGGLVTFAGYLEYRTVMAMRRLLDGSRLVPLTDQLLTAL